MMSEFKKNLNQLRLLLWKNYALQKRSVIGTILELAIPAFFAIILLPIRGIIKSNDHKNDTIFDPFQVDLWPKNLNPQPPSLLYYDNNNHWKLNSMKHSANEWWCLGYAPNNNSFVNNLMSNLTSVYYFRLFDFATEDEMVNNVTSGLNSQKCLGGISFLDTTSSNFTYKIRLSYSPRNSGDSGYVLI
jgi:ATP-binding cassette subfamily A (ABC1) protein 3